MSLSFNFTLAFGSVKPRAALEWMSERQYKSASAPEVADLRMAQYLCSLIDCMESNKLYAAAPIRFHIGTCVTSSPWYQIVHNVLSASEVYFGRWRGEDDPELAWCLGVMHFMVKRCKCLYKMSTIDAEFREPMVRFAAMHRKLEAVAMYLELQACTEHVPYTREKAAMAHEVLRECSSSFINWDMMNQVFAAHHMRTSGQYTAANLAYQRAVFVHGYKAPSHVVQFMAAIKQYRDVQGAPTALGSVSATVPLAHLPRGTPPTSVIEFKVDHA